MEPEKPLEVEVQEKEKLVARKRTFFHLWFYPFVVISFIFFLTGASWLIYRNYFAPKIAVVKPNPDNTQQQQTNAPNVQKNIQYKSGNLRLSLEYPKEAKMEDKWETPGQTKRLEISAESYIFRVSTFTTTIRKIDDIAEVKKEAVAESCPTTATYSDIVEVTIDGTEGRSFEAYNCDGDFTITYILKNNTYYEFAQFYKGDIGYKQTQKAITQEILDSVRFYPDPSVPKGPVQTYTNNDYKFSFEHPWLDSQCCDVSGPAYDSEKLIVLGDKSTYLDKDHQDAIGIYIHHYLNYDSYDSYLDKQRKSLADDYVVVRGTQPKLQEISLKVGGRDAILLRGYSWRDNDLIYVDLGPGGKEGALVISVKNTSGEEFQKVVDEILSSFKFF